MKMGDSSVNEIGLHTRAAALLNKKTFSDVEIQVKDGNSHKTFFAHKLFLAMGSQEFADMFYSAESPNCIKIFDYKPQTVYVMLQYLYTDILDLANVEETKDVYSLAKKYEVRDLQVKCSSFLLKEEITLENIFDKYEFALSENFSDFLRACRNFVSSQTRNVFKSSRFAEAPSPVVEDILKLDYLSVENEMEVIEAAIMWAKHESYRRDPYTENLRFCLYPLFKYLRFLTLSPSDFFDFVEKFDTILNSHESAMLTRAILGSGPDSRLPSCFSSNSSPRIPIKSISPTENKSLIKFTEDKFANQKSGQVPLWEVNNLNGNDARAVDGTHKSDLEQKIMEHLLDPIKYVEPSDPNVQKRKSKLISKELLLDPFGPNIPLGQKTQMQEKLKSDDFLLGQNARPFENKVNWEGKSADSSRSVYHKSQMLQKDNLNFNINMTNMPGPTSPVYKRSESVQPIYAMKQTPFLKVSPQITMNQRRTYEFPLRSIERSVTSASEKDIKCSAVVDMLKGAIEIHGVELKIQQSSYTEEIEAYLTLSGPGYPSKSQTYEEKLKNGVYIINFSDPVKLTQKNQIKIEIVVEDLSLNRCSGYNSETCGFNCGLGVEAQIRMKSNQSAGNEKREFYYLINRLIYRICQ